ALHALALEHEFEVALLEALMRVADRFPGALVPEHHRAAAILALGDGSFEVAIVERMVLDADGEALVGGVGGGPLGHGPALEYAIEFQAEIVVETGGVVFLHDEAAAAGLRLRRLARGFGGLGEITLAAIVAEEFLRFHRATWVPTAPPLPSSPARGEVPTDLVVRSRQRNRRTPSPLRGGLGRGVESPVPIIQLAFFRAGAFLAAVFALDLVAALSPPSRLFLRAAIRSTTLSPRGLLLGSSTSVATFLPFDLSLRAMSSRRAAL